MFFMKKTPPFPYRFIRGGNPFHCNSLPLSVLRPSHRKVALLPIRRSSAICRNRRLYSTLRKQDMVFRVKTQCFFRHGNTHVFKHSFLYKLVAQLIRFTHHSRPLKNNGQLKSAYCTGKIRLVSASPRKKTAETAKARSRPAFQDRLVEVFADTARENPAFPVRQAVPEKA